MLARLQTSEVDPAQEGMDAIQQVVRKLRRAGPKTRIIIRGDSGFSNNELMDFCETTPLVEVLSQNCIKYPFSEITPVEIIDEFLLNREEL